MNQPDPAKEITTETQEPQETDAPQELPSQPRSPIVDVQQVKRHEFFYRRFPPQAHVARVIVTTSGRQLVYQPNRQPTTGELLRNGARTVYDVDLGIYVIQLQAAPPSRGDRISFRADIDVMWRVVDPSRVVRTGLNDVERAVSPALLRELRAITRRYEIADLEKAEEAANERFRHSPLGGQFGLALEVFIRLAMDEESLSHAAIREKVEVFRKIISAGDFNQFALELALQPNDISTVVKMLVDERDSHRQAVFDFVTRLLESDALDRWQIDDQVRTTLQWLRDSGYKVLAGSDDARRFSYGDNHRESVGIRDNGSSPP